MAEGKFVVYFRVSTARQGRSGLELDAQRAATQAYLNGGNWQVVAEFTEIESGKHNDRPKLAEAFKACRVYGARLLIAKLDRLSRNAAFTMGLRDAGVDFVCADNPHATPLTIGVLAVVNEEERRVISERTIAALAAKRDWYAKLTREMRAELRKAGKATSLGGNRGHVITAEAAAAGRAVIAKRVVARMSDIAPIVRELRGAGVTSLWALARELTARGIPTSRGLKTWTAAGVARVLGA